MPDGRATTDRPAYFEAYAVGFCSASVCTDLHPDEAEARLNHEHPTGISSRWLISSDTHFATGEPHPFPCPDGEGRRHFLFTC